MCDKWLLQSIIKVLHRSYNALIHAVPGQVEKVTCMGRICPVSHFAEHGFIETWTKFDVKTAGVIEAY